MEKIILKAKPKKVSHSEFFPMEYEFLCGMYQPTIKNHKSLRKTVSDNLHKMRERRNLLNKLIKKGKIDDYTNYWWAKFWRKIVLLKTLSIELENEPDLPNYQISNRDRKRQVLEAVDASVDYYKQFRPLFPNVPVNYGWAFDSYKEFRKTLKEEYVPRKIPKIYMSYFRPQ